MAGPWDKYAQPDASSAPPPWAKYGGASESVAGAPEGGPPQLPAHPPAAFAAPSTQYNPGPGKGGYPEALRPVGNIGRTALNDFVSAPSQFKAAAQQSPKMSIGDAVGDLVGGPAYRPVKSLIQSANQSYQEGGPEKAATDTAGHLLSSTLAGEAAGGLVKGIDAIPRTGRAAAKFDTLGAALKDQPVTLANTTPHLQRIAEIDATGPSMPATANKLLNRSQATFPMNYPEARLFQENLSNPSVLEKQGIGGSMKGGIKQLKGGLFEDIKNAADTKGMGQDYADAMKEYRRAAILKDVAKNGGKIAVPAAVGGGIAGHYLRKLVE
jgi:hypothetical protein